MNMANEDNTFSFIFSSASDKCLTLLSTVPAHIINILIVASFNLSTVLIEWIFESHCFVHAGNTVCSVCLTGSFLLLLECLIACMGYIHYANHHTEYRSFWWVFHLAHLSSNKKDMIDMTCITSGTVALMIENNEVK